MKRRPVNSTALSSEAYDEASQTLELQFRDNGVVWQYYNIPKKVYRQFKKAESLGNFFVTRIKGHYPEAKVE
jgi:hypothetical protein